MDRVAVQCSREGAKAKSNVWSPIFEDFILVWKENRCKELMPQIGIREGLNPQIGIKGDQAEWLQACCLTVSKVISWYSGIFGQSSCCMSKLTQSGYWGLPQGKWTNVHLLWGGSSGQNWTIYAPNSGRKNVNPSSPGFQLMLKL